MAFDPTTQAWVPENDSVEGRVKGLMDVNSPLMKQAATQGYAAGNKRGLLNSSISVGAAQGEMYKQAVPIATADANLTGQKNVQYMQGQTQKDVTGMQTTSAEKISTADQVAAKDRLVAQLGSQEKLASAEQAAAKERLGMQLTSEEQRSADALKNATQLEQMRDQTTRDTTAQTLTSEEKRTADTIKGNKDIAATEATTARQKTAADTVLTISQINSNTVNAITGNENIPADTRNAYINHAADVADANAKVISGLLGIDIPKFPRVGQSNNITVQGPNGPITIQGGQTPATP